MRKSLRIGQLILLSILCAVFFNFSRAQCTIVSSNGYVVNVSIVPRAIVVSSANCPWGYNYNVSFDYDIDISGPGAASMYNLQAQIYCVNNQMNGAYSLPKSGGSGTAVTTTNPSVPHNGTMNGYNSPYVHCSDATIASMHCNSISLVIQGPGIPYQVIPCSVISPLPVEFLYLETEKTAQGNLLTWAVESEVRNDYFTIETSTDGNNWNELARVKGALNSSKAKTYSYLDTKNTQESVYYKLSQTDLDGVRNELALKFSPANGFDFRVYPNPTSDSRVHIDLSTENQGQLSVVLRNELGQVVFQQGLEASARQGKTVYYSSDLEVGQTTGVYLLELHAGNELVERSRLVVR